MNKANSDIKNEISQTNIKQEDQKQSAEHIQNNKEENKLGYAFVSKFGQKYKFDTEDGQRILDQNDFFDLLTKVQYRCLKFEFPQTNFPQHFQLFDQSLKNQYETVRKFNLTVRESGINFNQAEQLATIISKFKKLQSISLSLRGNTFGDNAACCIMEGIRALKELTIMKIGFTGCLVEDGIVNKVVQFIKDKQNEISKLQVHLGGNTCSKVSIIQLISSISLMQNLTTLSLFLDRLYVDKDTIQNLCQTIVKLEKLTKISTSLLFSNCNNSDYCKLARILQNQEKIETLMISMRESFQFNDLVLRNLALITFKPINVILTFEFGTVNGYQEKTVRNYIPLKLSHVLQTIAFFKNISAYLPLNSSHVLFDLADV